VGRLGLGLGLVLRLGLGLALGLQLWIGIGFRRNHSWSSTFMPRRNHSLCLCHIKCDYPVCVLADGGHFEHRGIAMGVDIGIYTPQNQRK